MAKIKLGDLVIDKVTGFVGTVVAKAEYLNGCIQYGVKPKVDKDGKMVDVEYIDVDQLESLSVADKKGYDRFPQVSPPGGIMPDRPKH